MLKRGWAMEWNDKNAGTDSLKFLSHIYYKIVKINLTTEIYEGLKDGSAEVDGREACGDYASAWLKSFVESGQI